MTQLFHWAGAAHLFLAAATKLGVSDQQILAAAGMTPDELPPSQGRIDWPRLRELTRVALELTGEPALGLLAGQEAAIPYHGIAGGMYMHSSPLRVSQSLAYEVVYPRLINTMRFWHEEAGDLAMNCAELTNDPPDPLMEPHIHLVLSQHLYGMRAVFGPETTIDHLSIVSTSVGSAEKLSALLRCPVKTGQPRDWVAIPRKMLEAPLPLADPWMRQQLQPLFDAYLRQLENESLISVAVRSELEGLLGTGAPTDLDKVASQLRLKPRTLQARLAGEGTSFSAELDAARKAWALRSLSIPGVKLAAVAAQVGFSDPAAFTRAFRRWTGKTPKAWLDQSPGRSFGMERGDRGAAG